MSRLLAFALSNLPFCAQKVLARHPDLQVRLALAASTATHLDIIDTLADDQEPDVRGMAYRRTRNVDRLTWILSRENMNYNGGGIVEHASANPNAPTGLLGGLTECSDRTTALNAFCNPSTYVEARQTLTTNLADTMVTSQFGSRKYLDGQMRASELVIANPWMANRLDEWSPHILAAFANSPVTTKSVLQAIMETHFAYPDWSLEIEKHPAWRGIDVTALDVAALLKLESGAADLIAMNRPEFTETDAIKILNRGGSPEPHITGRLIDRYGMVIAHEAEKRGEPSRTFEWLAPILRWGRVPAVGGAVPRQVSEDEYRDSRDAIALLGDNRQNWEAFATLLPDWYGTSIEAAETVCRL